jgi:hypothetical protein
MPCRPKIATKIFPDPALASYLAGAPEVWTSARRDRAASCGAQYHACNEITGGVPAG